MPHTGRVAAKCAFCGGQRPLDFSYGGRCGRTGVGQSGGDRTIGKDAFDFTPFHAALAGQRYLLVAPIAWYRDDRGAVWLDDAWHRDLLAHLEYIGDLTVLAPLAPLPDPMPENLRQVPAEPALRFVDFSVGGSTLKALLRAPATLAAAWRAVRRADIVHSGAAGWPLPPGMFINPAARLQGKPLVIVIESAFWRLTGPGPHGVFRRLRAGMTEALARWSIRRARLTVLTHEGYRDSLARDVSGTVMVIPASWIDADTVVPEAVAQGLREGPARLLLAARLTPEKGIASALEAVERAGPGLSLTVIGDGPLREQVAAAAERLGPERLRLLDPVPYGPAFFDLIREHDAVLVPTLSDEQPRILFDAYSQGRPALASDTAGNREAAQEGATAWLYAPGDVDALTRLFDRAAVDPGALRSMGPAARALALRHTHQQMHYRRAEKLAEIFGKR